MSKSIFVWNPDIGRRSRVNIKTGKRIRKRDDGSEFFDDYWTESESDEWMSDKDSFRNTENTKTKYWKESTRIEENVDKVNTSESEKENVKQKGANTPARRDSVAIVQNNNIRTPPLGEKGSKTPYSPFHSSPVRTPSAKKQNVTSPLAKSGITQTPTSSKQHKVLERKHSEPIPKSVECRSVEKHNSHTRKVLNFSDDEELNVNGSPCQENATSNMSNKRPDASQNIDKVSDNDVINVRKSFNFVSVNDKSYPRNANETRKSFGTSLQTPQFSESDDDDDDENFSFVLTNTVKKLGVSNVSFSENEGKGKNVAESKKVAEKRSLGIGNKSRKKHQRMNLPPPFLNSSDSESVDSNKKSEKTIIKEGEVQGASESGRTSYKTHSQKSNIKASASSRAKDGKGTSQSDERKAEMGGSSVPVKNTSMISKQSKYQSRNSTFSQKNSVEDEVARIHGDFDTVEEASGSEIPSHERADKEKDNSVATKATGKTQDKSKSKKAAQNFAKAKAKSTHSNSENDSAEKIMEIDDHISSRRSSKQDVSSSAARINQELEISPTSEENEKEKTGKIKKQKKLSKKLAIESSSPDNDNLPDSQSYELHQHKNNDTELQSLSKEKKGKDKGNMSRKEFQQSKLKHSKYNENDHSEPQVSEKMRKDKSNSKRKISPAKKISDKTMNVAQSKANIISPPPVRDVTPGVRRSKRVRIQPLEHWRNQRIYYQRSDTGYTIKGIEQGFDDEPLVRQQSGISFGRPKKRKLRKQNPSNSYHDISIHDLTSLTSNNIEEEANALVPIICLETGKEILQNVVSIHKSLEWKGMDGLPDIKDEHIVVAVALSLPNGSVGFMRIRGLQEKKLQYLPTSSALYVILHGKLLVQVNTTTFVLQTGDTFHVPVGNGYSIKNLRKDEAELQFTIFLPEEVETEAEC